MRPRCAPKSRGLGFTLLEMMIVTAVIAILAAIAYPSYQASVKKGRRAQARTAILELLQQQERYLTQRNSYMKFSNNAGVTDPDPESVPFKTYAGDTSVNPPYWLSASVCNAGDADSTLRDCVKVTATPVQSDPEVGSLSMSSTGVKSCTGTAGSSSPQCWP